MIRNAEKIFKALGERNRLRIVNMLTAKPMCVCEITDVLNLSQSTVSGHLRILKEAELIEDVKDGLWVEYSLASGIEVNKPIFKLLKSMLTEDPLLAEERENALAADRQVLCKK